MNKMQFLNECWSTEAKNLHVKVIGAYLCVSIYCSVIYYFIMPKLFECFKPIASGEEMNAAVSLRPC